MNHSIISIILWLFFFLEQTKELGLEFILRFVLLLLLDSIIVFCRCNNRIRATVKIVFKLLAHLWGILRFYVNNKNWDRRREESLQEDRSLKSKNWSGFVCHCKFKHCIYLFLSLHHLFELDFDRILNFKGILEKIFIYLYKLKI